MSARPARRLVPFAYGFRPFFLLTAVPSWTGNRGFSGPPLALLTAAWLAAYLLYLVVYAPILLMPRADGKPGWFRPRRLTRSARR